MIRKRGNYYVIESKTGKELGRYKNKSSAVRRLKQIEYFKSKSH